MDAPYFIEEHLWMSASDEAALKFSLWEKHSHKEFFVTKIFFLPINLLQLLALGNIIFSCYKDFSVHLFKRFHFMNTDVY